MYYIYTIGQLLHFSTVYSLAEVIECYIRHRKSELLISAAAVEYFSNHPQIRQYQTTSCVLEGGSVCQPYLKP